MLETPYHDGIEYWHEIPSHFRKGIFNMWRDFIKLLPDDQHRAKFGDLPLLLSRRSEEICKEKA